MPSLFERILRESKIAYGFFDQDLFLQDNSNLLAQYAGGRLQKKSAVLWDIFPELIGYEDKVQDILNQDVQKFDLDKLSRFFESGKLRYYTLTLLPYKDDTLSATHLLCLVTDTTRETSLEQQIQQQKYEILILHANLSTMGANIDTELYGESEAIQRVRKFVDKISQVRNTTILLQGESGTGKNLVARLIHNKSMDPDSPFVEINCASIPDTLIESEIFGYEKGAFTNALSNKKGLLEVADGGTLFLDEIGELPAPLQSKFLTFLETKRFRRLGSTREQCVQVRIITATNRDLKKEVREGNFRDDLFYRLNVVSTTLPPLRNMQKDVLLLAHYFIHIYSADFGKAVTGLTEGAKKKLLQYEWHGNVRELRNVIERAVIFCDTNIITEDEILLLEIDKAHISAFTPEQIDIPDQGISLYDIEKRLLQRAIAKSGGNQTQAAKLLDLSLDTFRYRIKKYKLD